MELDPKWLGKFTFPHLINALYIEKNNILNITIYSQDRKLSKWKMNIDKLLRSIQHSNESENDDWDLKL